MTEGQQSPAAVSLRRSLSSFNYRDFRRYWTGSGLTIVTIRIQEVVLGWQVLELTDSALWLGLVAFVYGLPLLFLAPVTGLMADRFRRQGLVMGAMALAAAFSLLLATLTVTHTATPLLVLLTSFAIGCAFALFAPARLALLPHLVPEEQLFNASSLEYTSTRLMGFVGPVAAGFLLDSLGIAPALFVQAALFTAAGVVFMRTGVAVGKPSTVAQTGVWPGLKEAVVYLRGEPPLLALVILGLFVVPFGMTYARLTQVFVRDVLHAGPSVLGLALGLAGLGSALSGMILTMLRPIQRRGRALLLSSALFAFALVALAFARQTPSALAILFIIGVASGVYLTISHVIFQTAAPDAIRGRVLSVWGMVWGLLPITSLIGGAVADIWGVTAVFATCGIICLVGCAYVRRPSGRLRDL